MSQNLSEEKIARERFWNFRAYLSAYHKRVDTSMAIMLRPGGVVRIRPRGASLVGDIDILHEVFVADVYCLGKLIAPGARVLDIGAHTGLFAVAAGLLGAEKIICIEPERTNFEILTSNAESNPMIDIVPIYGGFCATPCDRLVFNPRNVGGHKMSSTSQDLDKQEQGFRAFMAADVLQLLDDFQIGCLKIDCEGCEEHLLSFCTVPDTLKQVVVETHDQNFTWSLRERIKTKLLSLSFKVEQFSQASYREGNFSILSARR